MTRERFKQRALFCNMRDHVVLAGKPSSLPAAAPAPASFEFPSPALPSSSFAAAAAAPPLAAAASAAFPPPGPFFPPLSAASGSASSSLPLTSVPVSSLSQSPAGQDGTW